VSHRRLGRSRVFLDSSAFAAVVMEWDTDHAAALIIQDQLLVEGWMACSTNFVLAEMHALLLRRAGHDVAMRTLEEVVSSDTAIVRIGEEDEVRALEILVQYDDKDFSYTDATSFAVMERLGIDAAFTFDRHFSQYGFRTLAADET
jgi:predicted nucleic acid-binding protein